MRVLALIVAGCLLTACNDQRSSQLFFSCTGDLTHSYRSTNRSNGQEYSQSPSTKKATASLMLDEAKQAFAFKPSGDMAPAVFNKAPDDVAHKRTCREITHRWDETLAKTPSLYVRTDNCGDVWSDDNSLYFNLRYKGSDLSRQVLDVENWDGRLDRATGRLEVSSWVSNDQDGKNLAWGKADWALVCKKVDKLVDAK